MGVIVYSDTILVPLSIFVTVGYHAYLWHSIKTRPSTTTIGSDALRRNSWFLSIDAGDDKKGMLAVQSLRNTLMVAILTATITILVNLALAALTNNAFNARDIFSGLFFGSTTSSRIVSLKYGSASLFLVASFICSSLGIGFLIDANFLINSGLPSNLLGPSGCDGGCTYTQAVFERGFLLALFGNRLLCLTFPILMWMFGPVSVALSSGALVWVLYELDFIRRPAAFTKRNIDT